MKYRVKEVFRTLQGEGFHAGRAAVFIRLSSCNQWNGRDADRARDAARHGNRCALFCDTDFVGGDELTSTEILAPWILREFKMSGLPVVSARVYESSSTWCEAY